MSFGLHTQPPIINTKSCTHLPGLGADVHKYRSGLLRGTERRVNCKRFRGGKAQGWAGESPSVFLLFHLATCIDGRDCMTDFCAGG